MDRIRIAWSGGEVIANLRKTPTAEALLDALPCDSTVSTWGEEVYFSLPVRAKLEPDAQEVVDPGAVCFWVEGHSLALPYGPTPISKSGECRLVTRCNILGRIEGDPRELKAVREGEVIRLERVGDRGGCD